MLEKLSFLTAPRFIALVIGAVVFYLKSKGLFGNQEMVLIETILGGFIAVRTADRAAEQIGGNTPIEINGIPVETQTPTDSGSSE